MTNKTIYIIGAGAVGKALAVSLKTVNKKVDLVAKVKTPKDALYKIYKREGRRDKLTLLPMSDIEEIKFMEWIK